MLPPLIAAVVSPFAGRWADRIGHRWILMSGSLACSAGYFGYLLVLDGEPAVWNRFVPISVLIGL